MNTPDVERLVPYLEARAAAVAAAQAAQATARDLSRRTLPNPAALPDGTLVQVISGQWVVL